MQSLTNLTQVKELLIGAGKKTLYLVLKKKHLSVEIIEKLNGEFQKKLEKYIKEIIPKLQKMNPHNPEETLKYITLKVTSQILNTIMNENYSSLSEKDKITAEKIYNNEKEKQNINNEKIEDDIDKYEDTTITEDEANDKFCLFPKDKNKI